MGAFYRSLVSNRVFANVVLVVTLVLGAMAAFSIVRESQPNVFIPGITVFVAYPGADPEEVEEAITRKIEAAIDGIPGIKFYTSESKEGGSTVEMEVANSYDFNDVKDRVRNAVDGIETLPDSAESPRITQLRNRERAILVAVWGDMSERQLKEFAEEVRRELQQDPLISIVAMAGARPYEISIEVPQKALLRHGLSLEDVSNAIRRSSLNLSSGSLELEGEDVRIRTLGKRYVGPEFEHVVVKTLENGDPLTVGDLGVVRDTFSEDELYVNFNGEGALILRIEKAQGEDALTIVEAVKAYVEQKQATLPPDVTLTPCFDNTDFVRSQIAMLTTNGAMGLVLIVFILWLFLEARLSFWVAMGIPISLSGALVLMWLWGRSINQISLIAMIIVMGIVVDDAIVVGEAIHVQRRKGKSAIDAAMAGVREVWLPVIASVLTTIVAFLPMAFVPGFFGQFFLDLPLVVLAALTVSLVECLFLLPAHLNHRAKAPGKRGRFDRIVGPIARLRSGISEGLERFSEKVYGPTVRVAVRHRYVTVIAGISILLITGGLVSGGFTKVVMWPAVEGDHLDASIEFPPGTPHRVVREGVELTALALERVAARTETTSGDPIFKFVFSTTPSSNDTSGSVDVQLLETRNRGIGTEKLLRIWREEVGVIPGAVSQSFSGDRIGTGDGEDIDVWFQCDDFDALRGATGDFKEVLRGYEGVYQVSDNFRPGKREMVVTLKPEAHSLGLTVADLSRHLRGGYYGEEPVRLLRGQEEVRVRVRYPESERSALTDINSLRIPTPMGREVPFNSVAAVEFRQGVSSIYALDGIRGVRVSGAVDRAEANPTEINAELTSGILDEIVARYPGVTWSLTGSEQDNRAVMEGLQRGYLMAMLAIFVILSTIFRSYLQPLIIMVIIPFGIVGAVWAHFILGYPISFLSLFGITALSGVLVNDSIVLIERINTNLAEAMSLEDAVCRGGVRRFRAIILTSASTCAGIFPLLGEQSLYAQVIIPMAISLAGGLIFGTVLTLVLVPAFLVIMNDARRVARWIFGGVMPSPEEVEPARQRATGNGAPAGVPSQV